MIELRGVTKVFGSKRAVDQLDLTVHAGELYAFLGPNGAGKTTTIKMICGLLAPTAGTVLVGGHKASSREARQLLGYVPDQPYLYDKLSGREFLRFVVEMYGLDRARASERDRFADRDLRDGRLHRRPVRELLAGNEAARGLRVGPGARTPGAGRRRAAGGAGPRSARIVKNLFVSQARSGAAVLMSIHLLAIAEELADTIGIVDQGKMLTVGTLAQLREQAQHDGSLEDLFLKLTGKIKQPDGSARPGQRGNLR